MLHESLHPDDQLCSMCGATRQRQQGQVVLPLTFGCLNGKLDWHDKAPFAPKPLYRLNGLSHAPDAFVLLCEGEKAADAAQRIFPDYVGMSWMGGARADASADLAPPKGRTVFIWRDAIRWDAKRRAAGEAIAGRAHH